MELHPITAGLGTIAGLTDFATMLAVLQPDIVLHCTCEVSSGSSARITAPQY
jgi:hypothetical protein